MKKVLITGGAGYLGGAITDILTESGEHEFKVYDNLLYEEGFLKDVPFVKGDVRQHERLDPQLEWADVVIWLAALVGDGACAVNPTLSLAINHDSLIHLVQKFHGRILFPSTCSVYGMNEEILTEQSPLNPLSIYASTKLAAENVIKSADPSYAIFRLGTLYGTADRFSRVRFDLVVNAMTRSAYADKEIRVFGGDQYRPLLHVRDAAKVLVEQIEGPTQGTYNLSRDNYRMVDLAEEVANAWTPTVSVCVQDLRYEDSRNYRVSTSKLEAVGVDHQLGVYNGVMQIRALLEEERISKRGNIRYNNHEFLKEHGVS